MERHCARSLVEKAQSGDRQAFGFLFEMYRQRLEALIHLRLGPQLRKVTGIDDVSQETWVKALESIKRFQWRNSASFMKWLGGIAEHIILNTARRDRKRNKNRPAPPEGGGPSMGSSRDNVTPSQLMRRQERFERLEQALESLAPDYRRVIILARLRAFSRAEIGEQMGKSVEAVSMLLLRATQQLKRIFGDTESEHLPPRRLSLSSEQDPETPEPEERIDQEDA